jgi:hypothetical protein
MVRVVAWIHQWDLRAMVYFANLLLTVNRGPDLFGLFSNLKLLRDSHYDENWN